MTALTRPDRSDASQLQAARLPAVWVAVGLALLVVAVVCGVTIGPAAIGWWDAIVELLDMIPGVDVDSGLSPAQAAIVTEIRLPRVVLGAMVGALLSVTGAAYQGAFRNPLADPYLLGVAAGAGLGATLAIVNGLGDSDGFVDPVPVAAFAGALLAVAISYASGHLGGRSTVSLVLAGVAVASFLTALQTYVLQANNDVIREVYSWILGRLATSGWGEVALLLPYFIVTLLVVIRYRFALDVLAVGDEEAASLGLDPARVRGVVVLVASLGAAAAVSVSGLIGFVGIIIPHAVRLLVGVSHRALLPMTIILGAAFMVAADLVARTIVSPAELPIGVVTAMVGAPFFVLVLRASTRETW
jgi:iron complex transport system permease protein